LKTIRKQIGITLNNKKRKNSPQRHKELKEVSLFIAFDPVKIHGKGFEAMENRTL